MNMPKDIEESYRELYVNGKDILPQDAAVLRTALALLKKYDQEHADSLPGIDIIFRGSADADRTRQALRSLLKQIEFPKDRSAVADGDTRILTNVKKISFKEFLDIAADIMKKCKEYEQTMKK